MRDKCLGVGVEEVGAVEDGVAGVAVGAGGSSWVHGAQCGGAHGHTIYRTCDGHLTTPTRTTVGGKRVKEGKK